MSCIEWSQDGADIFCGFDLGRLVQFNVRFKDGVMKHIQLYPDNYGSAVVQLSVSENLLLVSTMDRAFLLDISTNKLIQVSLYTFVQCVCVTSPYELRLEGRSASLECMVAVSLRVERLCCWQGLV